MHVLHSGGSLGLMVCIYGDVDLSEVDNCNIIICPKSVQICNNTRKKRGVRQNNYLIIYLFNYLFINFAHDFVEKKLLTMKAKAIGNLDVAQQLINKKEPCFYTASIHCSYYAVFQYMKYMLAHIENDPISYNQQKNESQDQGSHDYLIDQIKHRIRKPIDARDFAQDVRALKKERVDADYETRVFDLEESLECKQQAEGLISKLKRYFGDR